MRKQRSYWLYNPRGFNNTYSLYYADGEEMERKVPNGAERITRKRAMVLAAQERRNRKENYSFAGFADEEIYPIGYDYEERDIRDDRNYELRNHIWERVVRNV